MARNYKQRFKVNADGSVSGSGANQQANMPGNRYLEETDDAVVKFQKQIITAEDAAGRVAAALRRYAEDIGLTLDQQKQAREYYDSIFGTDGLKRKADPLDLGQYQDKLAVAGRSPAQKLYDQLDEITERFTKKMIDAGEASRLTAAAINKLGEAAGYTTEERKKEAEAEASDQFFKGQSDPMLAKRADTQSNRLGGLFGRVGLPEGLGSKLGDMLGGWEPKGGLLGDLLGKGGLSSKFGAGDAAGGMARFAGPIAIATAGAKAMEAFYGGVTDVTRKLTSVGQSIAKNDGVGAITGLMDGIGSAAKKIPVVGGLLEKQIGMYSQFIKSFDVITEAFKSRGEELSKFSGPIAAASANAKVEKLLADINEGQRLGNEYAAIIREKTEAQVEFQKALEPIKMALMQQLIPIMKVITSVLKGYNGTMENIGKGVNRVADGVDEAIDGPLGYLTMLKPLKELAEKFAGKGERDKKDDNKILEMLFQFANADIQVDNQRMPQPVDQVPLAIDLFR